MKHAFTQLLEKASLEIGHDGTAENITKELLHYDILRAFSDSSITPEVTLHGGSALRLFYGGQRFSEDLDFVIGAGENKDFVIDEVTSLLRKLIVDRYGLELEVKDPNKDLGEEVGVKKWEYRIQIPGFAKKQMVKVEFCNVPAHDPQVMTLNPRYSFLGDHYSSIMLKVESKREIMADKVKAIVNRPFIKGRDLWDLKSLSDQGIDVDLKLVLQKFQDYHNENPYADLKASLERLKDPSAPAKFMQEMEKFLSKRALKGLYLTNPPGIDFIKFAIKQLETLDAHFSKTIEKRRQAVEPSPES